MLTERQYHFLSEIITTYIHTGEPVSSRLLAFGDGTVSSATVRNDMHTLEDHGYIAQTHTSSGRIPTEKGYKYYIEHFMKPTLLKDREKSVLKKQSTYVTGDYQEIKQLARELAELAKAVVVIGFHKDYLYYTGLSYLLREPEFIDPENIYWLTEALEQREQELVNMVDHIHEQHNTTIVVGAEGPLGDICSVISAPFMHNNKKSIISIVGPLRMDYSKNYSLMEFVKSIL